jgi:hypothetical protein
LSKIKENKGLRGDVLEYVEQARPQVDEEIGQKDHFRMETASYSFFERAPVAQLDRAPGFEPVGRRFESCRARHSYIVSSVGV